MGIITAAPLQPWDRGYGTYSNAECLRNHHRRYLIDYGTDLSEEHYMLEHRLMVAAADAMSYFEGRDGGQTRGGSTGAVYAKAIASTEDYR